MNIKKPTSILKEEKKTSLCFYSHRIVPNISYTIPSFVFMLILLFTDQKMKEKKKRKSCFCVWVFSVALNHTFFHKYFVSLYMYFKRLLGRKHQLSNWSRSRIILTIYKKKKDNKSQGKLVLVVCLRCKLKKMEKKTHTKQNNTVTDLK